MIIDVVGMATLPGYGVIELRDLLKTIISSGGEGPSLPRPKEVLLFYAKEAVRISSALNPEVTRDQLTAIVTSLDKNTGALILS